MRRRRGPELQGGRRERHRGEGVHRLAGASYAAAAPRARVMLEDKERKQIRQLQPHDSQRSYV